MGRAGVGVVDEEVEEDEPNARAKVAAAGRSAGARSRKGAERERVVRSEDSLGCLGWWVGKRERVMG